MRADVSIVAMRVADQGQRPEAPQRCPVLLFKLMQACWVAEMDKRPKFEQVLGAVEKIADTLTTYIAPMDYDACIKGDIEKCTPIERGLADSGEDVAVLLREQIQKIYKVWEAMSTGMGE